MTKLIKIGLPVIGISICAGYAWHKHKGWKSVLLYGLGGGVIFGLPILIYSINDKKLDSGHSNDSGSMPVLTDNKLRELSGAIYESKSPSIENIFSSDTVTPMDILQYQLFSKSNWARLQNKFMQISGNDLYSYLVSFLDKGSVDSAIANLA